MRRLILLTVLAALVTCGASAQTLTGTIIGKISDEQGGVLPGATVTLVGKTGSQSQVTDARGQFRFLGLAPGSYNIKSDLQGFRPKEQLGIDIGVAKTAEVNLTMVVGGLSESVDVVASAVMIDSTSAATDTNLSQDLLFSMPISHDNPAISALQYMPGVTDSSAFGGSSSTGNALLLDGVDTRDPEGGAAWTFYNYNIIDEIQVGSLGQGAEYGGFTGAVINTITKSGGNLFSFLGEYRYTNDSSLLLGDNTNPAIYSLNKNLQSPARTLSLKDYTVQLGGPIKKDRIFFFASVQRYESQQIIVGPIRTIISPRFNFKFSFQPTPSDTIITSLQYDQFNQRGRTGFIPAYAVTSQDQTEDQDAPEYIWNAQYRKVFNASTFLEAKFTGYWGYYDLNPVNQSETHSDFATGAYSGGAGYIAQYDRTRNQLNVAVSKYANAAGSHNFKFGMEIERSTVRDRSKYAGQGVRFADLGGEPYLAYGYSYDVQGKNKRESFYAQDQWRLASRFTVNLGLRADHITGDDARTGQQMYHTMSFGPRVGGAFDISGKGTSVLKGYYGQLYESDVFASWSRAVTGIGDYVTYSVGPGWNSLTEIGRVPGASKYTVGSDILHPKVDEFNFSWEQQFMKSFKFTATGVFRDWHNFVNSSLPNAQWTSGSYPLPAWTGGGTNPVSITSVPYYQWANPSIGQHFVIGNVDSTTYTIDGQPVTASGYRKYRGLMLVLERAYKDRWQAQFSWVISKTTGTINNDQNSGVSSGQFETPNTILVNDDGPTSLDRRHMVRLFVGYQIPKVEVSVNAYWRYASGLPYAPYVLVPTSRTQWSGSLAVNAEPRERFMTPSTTQTDFRIEKVIKLGFHRFGFYADVQNAFNQNVVQTANTRYPSVALRDGLGQRFNVYFAGPLTQLAGRQITLGGRWSF